MSQMNSLLYKQFNQMLGIKVIYTSRGHPQANGRSERINKSIKYSIQTLISEGHNFVQAVNIHKSLYNGSTHSSTNFTPNLLHFGRELALIFDTFNVNAVQPHLDKPEMFNYLQGLQRMYKLAYKNSTHSQSQNYNRHQRNARLRKFKIDDIVYVRSIGRFNNSYSGPFTVVNQHSPVLFSLQNSSIPSAKIFKIHVNRLILAPPRHAHLCHPRNTNPPVSTTTSYNLRPRN